MNDAAVETADALAEAGGDFGGFLRSAGRLAAARQVSALCLVAAVFVLPAVAHRGVATDFVWAYFAMLTLTSVLGLGFERLAGIVSAARGDAPLARVLAPVATLRLATLPAVALGQWALFWFVGVHLSATAWWATFAWVVAGLAVAILFGGLRATGDAVTEPVVMIVVRAAQALCIVGLAVAGASLVALVGAVALCEWAGVVAAGRAAGHLGAPSRGWFAWRALPRRRALAYAGIEVVGIANLRMDLLLVGHMLGAVPGATYGLMYRVVDAFNGVVGSAGLWLFAEGANNRDGGVDRQGLRARSLALLPAFGVAIGLLVVLGAGLAGSIVPRVGAETDTLRLLAVAFPILSVNAVELHVRAGRGRTREVLWANSVTLAVNLPLCIAAISAFGLAGAAAALVVSELVQASVLWWTASRDERSLLGSAVATAMVGGAGLLVATGALSAGSLLLAGLATIAVMGLVVQRLAAATRTSLVTT